ncbi:hypothetical protein U6N26_12380, partial [Cutibacterium acnes]
MNRSTPRLEIFADRIRDNARAIVTQCAKHGVQVAAVTKVLHAHPVLLQALEDTGITMLADSRLQNLRQIAECGTSLPTMLLRAPGRHDIDGLRVKMCVWLGVSRGLDLAFLNAD